MSLPLRSSATGLLVVGALLCFAAPAEAVPSEAAPAGALPSDQPATIAAARQRGALATGMWLRGDLSSSADRDVFRLRVQSRQVVMITLGDLPADYRLALYGWDGRRIAVSDEAGSTFEQLAPQLSKGDYYIEVAPSRGAVLPGRPYRLMARRLAGRLVVLDSHRATGPDATVVTGELLNNARSWQERPVVTARFYDRAGRLVATSSALAERTLLAHGERAAFRIVAPPVPEAVRHVVRVVSRSVTPHDRPELSLAADLPYPLANGRVRHVGRVATVAPAVAARVHVHVLRYNSVGDLVDFGHALLPAVRQRSSRYDVELPPYPYSTTSRVVLSEG